MKIDHVGLYVLDLPRAKAFFERYFNAVPTESYHNPRTGLSTVFLTFDGTRLELMHRPAYDQAPPAHARGYAHIALTVGDRAAVDQLTERLRKDGYPVLSGPRVTGDGYYESVIQDQEGNSIELVT